MLYFLGVPAHSDFQLNRISREPFGKSLFLYLVAPHAGFNNQHIPKLEELLGGRYVKTPPEFDCVVTPRVGTISSWSTKATEIATACSIPIQRIERAVIWTLFRDEPNLRARLFDAMTESLLQEQHQLDTLFDQEKPKKDPILPFSENPLEALQSLNTEYGLALNTDEMHYLINSYHILDRPPQLAELCMFAQANSEHCRHKIFKARWTIGDQYWEKSLFDMIRFTHQKSPGITLSAYTDNAAVIEGYAAHRFFAHTDRKYKEVEEPIHIAIKVENHNHPTAISPNPGAGTGAGGEIRDEGATGRGGKPKAGLTGFSVSNLEIPNAMCQWESERVRSPRIASSLQIMIDGPVGAASFNNEFGRPNLCGYFRTFYHPLNEEEALGYDKPIMLAGGYANVREEHVWKEGFAAECPIVVLGGPAMLIGLGGGAASSIASGTQAADLDFASVQRANPEMQRRCQEVIDRCWAMGTQNPILSIHDVGAGGLSNALPELVHDAGLGAHFHLRAIPSAEKQLSPMEIWCNEAQERYVLALNPESFSIFQEICTRENAPFAVVGRAKQEDLLRVSDSLHEDAPIDIPISILLAKTPRLHKKDRPKKVDFPPLSLKDIDIQDAALRVLRLPTVASKSFLITIGDRSITGMVARDQFTGRWQLPLSDVAVSSSGYREMTGEAMAMGERPPLAMLSAAAAGRMAITEAITNIAAARIGSIQHIRLSANWMVAAKEEGEGAKLYETVKAIAEDFCPRLGVSIPVGKDSMSMQASWTQDEKSYKVRSPLSLVVTAFAPVLDVQHTLTPDCKSDLQQEKALLFIDLGEGNQRLGASSLAYVYGRMGTVGPDMENPELLVQFFSFIQFLNHEGFLLSYHDRSDGGLWATMCEMAFGGRCGLNIDITELGDEPIKSLFCEEAGAVFEVLRHDVPAILDLAESYKISHIYDLGSPCDEQNIQVQHNGNTILNVALLDLLKEWTECSYQVQSLRDNPVCAREERESLLAPNNRGLFTKTTFNIHQRPSFETRPPIAILREQGVNGQLEMAAAFSYAGFDAIDVHMNDIRSGKVRLSQFRGLIACGGFSYGDVLGAGSGWAKSILYSPTLRQEFKTFFHRKDTFALGVCNGCQLLSQLAPLIPGAEHWPRFHRNLSQQFEARLSLVEVLPSSSIFFKDMEGSVLPIPVAHGEGRVVFTDAQAQTQAVKVLRYVDNHGQATEHFPENPNGSPDGLTAFTSQDGRVTIMMPHPERAFRSVQLSWHPKEWGKDSPWMKFFENARRWVEEQEKA
ncbi:MAG: phosphoribosylformylglycinamidine synthase [Myxococcota bacterium]|nr:phosphoribosylformylglycinamidine synthase [Myxococcota bacterium]